MSAPDARDLGPSLTTSYGRRHLNTGLIVSPYEFVLPTGTTAGMWRRPASYWCGNPVLGA